MLYRLVIGRMELVLQWCVAQLRRCETEAANFELLNGDAQAVCTAEWLTSTVIVCCGENVHSSTLSPFKLDFEIYSKLDINIFPYQLSYNYPLIWTVYILYLPSPYCGCTRTSRKARFLGKALVVCLEGFPHHHAGSRIQLNQSVWKTSCLVTCGFRRSILRRVVDILESGLDREARCKYCQGRPRWADGERFCFSTDLSGFSCKKENLWDPVFSSLVVLLSTNITTVVES